MIKEKIAHTNAQKKREKIVLYKDIHFTACMCVVNLFYYYTNIIIIYINRNIIIIINELISIFLHNHN